MKDGLMLDVSLLEEMLEKGEMKVPRIIYTIPSYQNPMASTLPVGDRRKLARLAERHGIIVVADEVYHMLDWRDGARPARMASFNSNESCPTKGCCLSVSSFTKIFCPGVRCGWVEGPPHIIQSLKEYGYIRSQGGCVPFVGEAMRIALESGIANKVLADLRSAYKERANVLCRILKEGDIPVVVRPLGGYFLCIKLSVHATKFSSYCTERGLKFLPGTSCDPFSLIESPHSYYGRLCFADLPMSELEQGARRLVHLWKEFQEGNL
jgi:2-aminoadipate transaminase